MSLGWGPGPAWSGSERGSLAVSKPRHLRTRAVPCTGPALPGEETRAALAEQTEWTVVSQRFINKLWACLCILASVWYKCINIRILVCLLVDTAQVKLFESLLLPFHLLLAPTNFCLELFRESVIYCGEEKRNMKGELQHGELLILLNLILFSYLINHILRKPVELRKCPATSSNPCLPQSHEQIPLSFLLQDLYF